MKSEHFSDLYINGTWVASAGTGTIDVVNPADESVLAAVPDGTPADVDAAVSAARGALSAWSSTAPDKRAAYLRAIAQGIEDRAEELIRTISDEMGTPHSFAAELQLPLPVNSFRQAADLGEKYAYERPEGPSRIVREPIGVVGAITPWNYPLHQLAGKVAFALAAGNTVVVKPSEVAPLNAVILAEIIDAAGLPDGVFNLISGRGPTVGEALVAHPDVDMISFTGSTPAGRRVGELAAQTVKRVALELGGKSPNIMLDDADPAEVVPHAVQWAFLNSGQTCSALTRLLVPRSKIGEVESIARHVAESFTVGAPDAEDTVLGPLVSEAQLTRVRGYIEKGVAEGAKLVTGGVEPIAELPVGYYVRPTVFSEVTTDMSIHREEIFGPVLSVIPYDTEDDAVRIANDTEYGLAASVWSGDTHRARAVARRIRAGQIAINGADFNPNAPFGGHKQSGNGREFGIHGLEEFLEVKAIQG
ncbi:aldehyde dehydrogenase family protein [Gordonia insulae]|uniref:aldehyde dehydrogenase (NAD(+)) n=1 Tax=Gordonia insulae TaxID=2420509 RepID=A0A3G8JQA7_9ACTN|nr:aldehyde dehydrogenase family protein [Gordonia insulae]AZG47156.1 3-succinoylsemialdehyde-pyridine dehydrogenase [Gordonia insulae]